jgi:hypothetical protein
MASERERIAEAVAGVLCPGEYANKTCYKLAERIEAALRVTAEAAVAYYIPIGSGFHEHDRGNADDAIACGIAALEKKDE